jgi:hypothetical protein
MMINNSTSKLWDDILRQNEEVLQNISKTVGGDLGKKEVEFRSTFTDRKSALGARKALIGFFPFDKDYQIFIVNHNDVSEAYDCLLSKVIRIEAKAITEIEIRMMIECNKYGGDQVSWEFLSKGI